MKKSTVKLTNELIGLTAKYKLPVTVEFTEKEITPALTLHCIFKLRNGEVLVCKRGNAVITIRMDKDGAFTFPPTPQIALAHLLALWLESQLGNTAQVKVNSGDGRYGKYAVIRVLVGSRQLAAIHVVDENRFVLRPQKWFKFVDDTKVLLCYHSI